MTATIELSSARRKLQGALGESQHEYFRQMKLWFRKRISKDDFDIEARKLLSMDSSHLHNEFLLAILNKCQTLANFTPAPPKTLASTAELLTPRKYDPSGDRLKRGKIKRKSKSNRPSFDHRFQPVTVAHVVHDCDDFKLFDEEQAQVGGDPLNAGGLRYAYQEPTLPDASLIHGRILVSCWEEGLESVDDEAVKIIVLAVEQQLRTLVKGLLMQRNGYKLRDGKFPHAVGSKIPNPWVLNTQRRLNIGSKRMADVAELLNVDRKTATAAGATGGGQSGEIDPLVPVGRPTILDAEQREAFEDACAGYNEEAEFLEKRSKLPVSLFDLMRLMKQQKSLIPSHTVYALNMERLISRLHQKGEYSD